MSIRHGDLISSLIERGDLPWNRAFEGRPIVISPDNRLPRIHLMDGAVLTLLSPTWRELRKLRAAWYREMSRTGLTLGSTPHGLPEQELGASGASEHRIASRMQQEPAVVPRSIDVEALAHRPFREDASAANGSSIAFLAEIEGRSLLIGGDARADVLVGSIKRLLNERNSLPRLPVSLFVVPHGGSHNNISKELLELIACDRYVFATSGERFRHPDPEAIARVIVFGRDNSRTGLTLVFNYRSAANAIWDDKQLQARYSYKAIYPEEGRSGMKIRL